MSAIQANAKQLSGAYRVKDLIARLMSQDPDAIILVAAPCGDRWATTAALPITHVDNLSYDEQVITHNGTSSSGMAIGIPRTGVPGKSFPCVILQ